MDVYQLGSGANRFRALHVAKEDWNEWRKLASLQSLVGSWRPPSVRYFEPGETGVPGDSTKRPLPLGSDTPMVFCGLMIVVTEHFVAHAGALLSPFGEFLPCLSPDGNFFVYHCTHVVDALDRERSELSVSSKSGDVLNVKRYVFRDGCVPDRGAFRLPIGSEYVVLVPGPTATELLRMPLRGLLLSRVYASGGSAGDARLGGG